MDCHDSPLVSNMSLMLHVVFWEQREGWRRGKRRGAECGVAPWQQQILDLLNLGTVTDVTQPTGTSTALTLHFHCYLQFFLMCPYSKESLLLICQTAIKIKKIKAPNSPLDFAHTCLLSTPCKEPWRKWHTIAIAHSSPLQVFDEAELRPQLQNTVWCWWCGDVVLIMNSIRARVKMHRVQRCLPHWSQLSQQLCAVDSLPFPLQGGLTLSVAVSIWFPLQWKCCRQRISPVPVQTWGRVGRTGPCLEEGDDLVWWRGCLCSQQRQVEGGTGRVWGQAAVSVHWRQNIHAGRQFVSWDFNFCLSIPDLCCRELSRAVISSSLHMQELSFCNLSLAFRTSGES